MARDNRDRSSWPTMANTHALGMFIAGICGTCQPPRRVAVDMAAAIAKVGGETKTRDVMDRVTCSVCGSKVPVSLAPPMAHVHSAN